MLIVGLTGNIGSGKTTFARFLGNASRKFENFESSDVITEVANELRRNNKASHPESRDPLAINRWLACVPQILASTVRHQADFADIALTPEKLQRNSDFYTKLFEYLDQVAAGKLDPTDLITAQNKSEYRTILQWLGGYLAKTVDGQLWFSELLRRALAVSDLDLATFGGVRFPDDAKCLKQASGYIISIERPDLEEADSQDLTEREKSSIRADINIVNNGSLADLALLAKTVLNDMKKGALQRTYFAKKPNHKHNR
jgi:hypothetical protein